MSPTECEPKPDRLPVSVGALTSAAGEDRRFWSIISIDWAGGSGPDPSFAATSSLADSLWLVGLLCSAGLR
jgi:hypothetical protein